MEELDTFVLDNNSKEYFGWSFYLAWSSIFLQGLAGGIITKIATKFKGSSKLNNFI